MARSAVLTVAVALAACGAGGGSPGGGGANLPTAGLGPYGKLQDPTLTTPASEPYVVVDRVAHLTDPAAVAGPEGFRLWFTRTPLAGGATEIWVADLPTLSGLPSGLPARSLVAAEPWEAGSVRSPSVVALDSALHVLLYQAGETQPAIARAESRDGGSTWERVGVVVEDAADPSALVVDGRWYLYFTRPGRHGIFLAESDDGLAFTAREEPVLQRRDTDLSAFDRLAVGEPAAEGGVTAGGQVRIALFYTGVSAQGATAVGCAVSEDGATFARFGDGEPVLEPGLADEHGPAAVLGPQLGVLFFSQRRTQAQAIAGATCGQ